MRRSVVFKAWCMALVIVFFAVASAAAQPARLRLHLEQGKVYKLYTLAETHTVQTIMDQEISVAQRLKTGYTFHVTGVDADGNATVEVTYDSLQFRMDGPGGRIQYDSAAPVDPVPPEAQGLALLVGARFTLELAPSGAVRSVKGLDAMFQRALGELAGLDPEMEAALQKDLTEQFGDRALTETMQKLFGDYPGREMNVGDTWTARATLSKGVPMVIDTTLTLKSIADGIVTVGMHSRVSPNPDGEPLQIGPLTMRYEISGEESGTAEYDEATGWVRRSEVSFKFAGTMRVDLPDAPKELNDLMGPVRSEGLVITSSEPIE